MDSDKSPQKQVTNTFVVQACEASQKLLMLLERRLHLPANLLHRWIRTGQVRRNGGRCQPFERVNLGDSIRIPPFALKMSKQSTFEGKGKNVYKNLSKDVSKGVLAALPSTAGQHSGLICYIKPQGLPTHGGSGHLDSLAARLQKAFAKSPFVPVPVHRLDLETSGLILVAETFAALTKTQEDLRAHLILKDYLCWVEGAWEYQGPILLQSFLARLDDASGPKVQVVDDAARGKFAESLVLPLVLKAKSSLLLVRILTGRTHQIRVQMANMKHPILGDVRYGPKVQEQKFLLHSTRITLNDGTSFLNLPAWPSPYEVTQIPDLSQVLEKAKQAVKVKI